MKANSAVYSDRAHFGNLRKTRKRPSRRWRKIVPPSYEIGYAVDDSEHADELRCIAAPIRFNKQIVGSIGISAPAPRLADSLYAKYGKEVCAIADKIGESLRNSE